MKNDLILNMKLQSDSVLNANMSGGVIEVDPIFRESPAYTITYNDITYWNNKSNFSGNYNDLRNKPVIPHQVSQLTNDVGYITKTVNNLTNYTLTADLSTVAISGDYDDLLDKPTIPTKTSDLNNDSGFITNTVNDLTNYTLSSSLSTVATTGSYNDLSGTPTLANVATSGLYEDLINKPTLSVVASTGDYDDLLDKPTIPTKTSDLNNDSGFIINTVNDLTNYTLSSALSTVATTGDYNDLINKPSGLTLDSTVSTTSTNGVENQAITNYVDGIKTLLESNKTTLPEGANADCLMINDTTTKGVNLTYNPSNPPETNKMVMWWSYKTINTEANAYWTYIVLAITLDDHKFWMNAYHNDTSSWIGWQQL